jgi:hypothetical protein
MKEDTYTYTARSVEDPAQVVTFTLHDHSMSVDLGTALEYVERALQPEQADNGATAAIEPLAKPMALSVWERVTRPFSVADVDASVVDNWLRVTSWVRALGLRLAPIPFVMEQVDNPDAAHAFVDELNERKQTARRPGTFRGPLDYWITWLLGSLLITLLVWVGLRRGENEA